MLHEYGAYSGTFHLPTAGCTTIVEAPIDWGTVEVLPAPSERCETSAAPPHKRQVARVIPHQPPPGLGRPLLGREMLMLLNQLLQQEPGPPGPPPPSSSRGESVESGEWWDDDGVTVTMMSRVVPPVVLRATLVASAVVMAEVASTRKVINTHCILTCV